MPARPIEEQEAEGTVDLKLVNTYKGRQVCGAEVCMSFSRGAMRRSVLRGVEGQWGGLGGVEAIMQWRGRARRATRQ